MKNLQLRFEAVLPIGEGANKKGSLKLLPFCFV